MTNNTSIEDKVRCGLAITGGGTEAISMLLRGGGGSSFLEEAVVPYSGSALSTYLGVKPDKFCSVDTARMMAMASYEKLWERAATSDKIGIGVTCKLRKDDEREGRVHEFHIAVQTCTTTESWTYRFKADDLIREIQERIVAMQIVEVVGKQMEKHGNPLHLEEWGCDISDCLRMMDHQYLVSGKLWYEKKDHIFSMRMCNNYILFPGSFNPLHSKHIEMAKLAHKKYDKKVVFEVCMRNERKPPINLVKLESIIDGIYANRNEEWYGGYLVTNVSTMVEKARLLSDGKQTIMMGWDTWQTLLRLHQPMGQKEYGELVDSISSVIDKCIVFQRYPYTHQASHLRTHFPSHDVIEFDCGGVSSSNIRRGTPDE